MTSDHFFVERDRIGDDRIVLEGREYHHLSRVARCRAGDEVWLFDACGTKYRARIESIETEKATLSILSRVQTAARRASILLGQAVLKAKGMELVVQKATELGVTAVFPLLAARSVVRIEERGEKKAERWARIAREASKQSRSCLVPEIPAPEPLEKFLAGHNAALKIVLSESEGRPLREVIASGEESPPRDVLVLVGPEGGWTPDEEDEIGACGYVFVSLGPSVLRAETAALAAISILSHYWNR